MFKAHNFIYVFAFISYIVAIFLFILTFVLMFTNSSQINTINQPYVDPITFNAFRIGSSIVFASWSIVLFIFGLLLAAFADLVRSNIRSETYLENMVDILERNRRRK